MEAVGFARTVENVVQIVEGAGVAILVVGGLLVFLHSEVLIVADIVRKVIVDQSAISVAVLATIVLIRIVLSWSLAVEIDGVWPWRKGKTE